MISTQIQAIVSQLTGAPAFLYGTADELNAALHAQSTFPVVCLYKLPPMSSSFTKSFAINNNFALQLKFLKRSIYDQNTSDNEAIETEMLALSNEFMIKLANYRETQYAGRYFRVNSNDKAIPTPVYNDFDDNLTGIKLTMNVKTMFNDNVPLT